MLLFIATLHVHKRRNTACGHTQSERERERPNNHQQVYVEHDMALEILNAVPQFSSTPTVITTGPHSCALPFFTFIGKFSQNITTKKQSSKCNDCSHNAPFPSPVCKLRNLSLKSVLENTKAYFSHPI